MNHPEWLIDGPADSSRTLVLAHGAGQGMRSESMAFFAGDPGRAGLRVVRFEFPYMVEMRWMPYFASSARWTKSYRDPGERDAERVAREDRSRALSFRGGRTLFFADARVVRCYQLNSYRNRAAANSPREIGAPGILGLRWALVWLLLSAMGTCTATVPCVSGSDPGMLSTVPLSRRVQPAPAAVTELALSRNLDNGVAIAPRPASLDHPLVPVLYRMLSDLPTPLRRLAQELVSAIYLLRDNFGSARVEAAHGARGGLIGGCILLNLDALARRANDWASWREESAFRTDERVRIRLTLEPQETNSVENALRFVFLHELGHVLGMAAGVHGFWAAPETWWVTARSPYTRLSWQTSGGTLSAEWKRRFPLLSRPLFYRFELAPLSRSAAHQVYRALAQTNWPSLYGSIDPYEDFAEAFALYVHRRVLHRPYRVDLFVNGERIGQYHSCLDTGRCPRKVAYLGELISRLLGPTP